MRFWDASAIVPLLITERTTAVMQELRATDPGMLVWWSTGVECASALARAERLGVLSEDDTRRAFDRLAALAGEWLVVDPVDAVRDAAIRFLRVHDLRAGDALQLAAAYLGSERRPAGLEFVCRDDRLARAAEREGFVVR